MKIATYNVNSINARLPNLLAWLERAKPDVVLLQEIKCEFNAFPFFDLQLAGYEAKILGQKSYNGVAVLSRGKIAVTQEGLPGFADENSRYLDAAYEFVNNTHQRVEAEIAQQQKQEEERKRQEEERQRKEAEKSETPEDVKDK